LLLTINSFYSARLKIKSLRIQIYKDTCKLTIRVDRSTLELVDCSIDLYKKEVMLAYHNFHINGQQMAGLKSNDQLEVLQN
jgi:hypothetical protein